MSTMRTVVYATDEPLPSNIATNK